MRVHSQELFRPFLKDIPYKNVDSVIFVGQHIADIAVRDHNVPRRKSIVVPNPVDTDVRQAAKSDDVRFHIGLVGIVPAQNISTGRWMSSRRCELWSRATSCS